MVGSKRSSRIAARKSRRIMNNVHSDQDGDEDREAGSSSTKCGADGESALFSVEEMSVSLDSASDHLCFPSTGSVESNKRRGTTLDADSKRRRSSGLSDKSEHQSNTMQQQHQQNLASNPLPSFSGMAEKEDLDGAKRRMRSDANLSGGSKRSKQVASDDYTSDSIANSVLLTKNTNTETSFSLSNILSGLKDETAASRKLEVDDEGSKERSPQHEPQHCDEDVKNGRTQFSTAAMSEAHLLKTDHTSLHPSSEMINVASLDEGNPGALTKSDSPICKEGFRLENRGGRSQIDLEISTETANNTLYLSCKDIVEEHSTNASEIPEPTHEQAEVSRPSIESCESNETNQNTTHQSISLSADKDERNVTENCITDNAIPRDNAVIERGDSQTITNVEFPSLAESLTDKNSLITTKRNHKSPSISQLKMALFLEASKSHSSRNEATRMFAKYWDTLGKYLSLSTRCSLKKVHPDLGSRASIEPILGEFLKTRKMKILHNKIILSIMAEAMKTHVPAHYLTHAPRQWKNELTRSLSAPVSDVKNDCCHKATALSQWNTNFGPQSGTWTACGGDIILSKTDCGSSIDPELIGSIHSGVLAEESIFPSCRLPGALDIDPLVRRLSSHSGVKVSEYAVWMIIVAVREYSSSLLKKVIANDKDFGCGHAPRLPNHFRTSLACHHISLPKSELLVGEERVQDERLDEGEPKTGFEKCGKRVITSTCLSNILAENLSASSRLTSMYTTASLNDRRGTSHLAGLDAVKCLVNSSIQKAASRRYKSSPEFEVKSSSSATTINNSDRATPIHTNTRPSNIQPDETHAQVVPPPTTAHSFPASFPNSLLHHDQPPQRISLPIEPQCPSDYPAMPFQRVQESNQFGPMVNPLGRRNSEIQSAPRPILPILRPNREHPLMPPQLFTNKIMERPPLSSPTATPVNTPALRRGSKNMASMIRGENEEGITSGKEEEGKADGKDITTPSASNTSPITPHSSGYGVKNLAAMKARSSFTSSTETEK